MYKANELVTEAIQLAYNLSRLRMAAYPTRLEASSRGLQFYRLCHLERLAHTRIQRRLEKLLAQ